MIATGWVSPPTAKDLASKVITWRARLEQATVIPGIYHSAVLTLFEGNLLL